MKANKNTESSGYLGLSISDLKTLANNGKINYFKTSGDRLILNQINLDTHENKEKSSGLTKETVLDFNNSIYEFYYDYDSYSDDLNYTYTSGMSMNYDMDSIKKENTASLQDFI